MTRWKKRTNALLAIDGFAQTLDVVHLTVSDIDAQADFRLLIQSQRAKKIASTPYDSQSSPMMMLAMRMAGCATSTSEFANDRLRSYR